MNIVIFFRILALLGSVFCLSRISVFVYPVWILIILYTLYVFLSRSLKKGITTPGLMALHLAMFGRYVLLPFVFYLTGIIPTCAKSIGYLNEAIYLMFYEQICVFIAIEATANYPHVSSKNNSNSKIIVSNKSFLVILLLVFFVFLTIQFKDLSFGFNVLMSGNLTDFNQMNDVLPEQSSTQVIIGIVWQVLSIWLYVHLMLCEKQEYDKDHKVIHVNKALIYSFFLILVSFIDQNGLSRWYTIVNGGTAIACLMKFFPVHKNRVFLAICVPGILLIAFATLVKNAGYVVGQGSVSNSWIELLRSEAFDSYFAGPVNVNNIFYIEELNKTNITTIINDALNNMPIVNHYFNKAETTNYLHNLLAGRIFGDSTGDQIVPLIGQSYIYFGALFSPLLSILSVILVRLFDYKFRQNNSYLTFVYAFCSIWFGVEAMALNLTICLSWFYVRIIPDYIALNFLYKNLKSK